MVSYDGTSTDSEEERFRVLKREEYMREAYDDDDLWVVEDREYEDETRDFAYAGYRRRCFCGQVAPRYTCLRKGRNSGRRYFACENWTSKNEHGHPWCQYLKWLDEPFSERPAEFVAELMGLQDELKAKLETKVLEIDALKASSIPIEQLAAVFAAGQETKDKGSSNYERNVIWGVFVLLGLVFGLALAKYSL